MKLREVMRQQVMTIREDDDLALASQMIAWSGVRHLPVVRDGRVVGVLSERDIFRHLGEEKGKESLSDPVGSAMAKPAKVAHPDEDVTEAAARMSSEKLGCLPVVEQGRLLGLVTMTELLAHQVRESFVPTTATGAARPVGAVMTRDPKHVMADDYLLDAAARMSHLGVRHLPVVDAERRVVGLLSDRHIRSAIGDPRRALEEREVHARVQLIKVDNAMDPDVRTARENTPLAEVAGWLLERHTEAVPVVDAQGRLVGIVSYIDALRELIAKTP